MPSLVPAALFGWIPAILLLFLLLPARQAVVSAYVGAWLFLPMAGYNLAGLPDYDKVTATTGGVLLAAVLFDSVRLARLRPSVLDIPMALWCIAPSISSLANGLGAWDAVSAFMYQTITWGLPYLVGRVYFVAPQDLRVLAMGIVIGGILYVPLCLYEVRMSPQLHRIVYGFFPHDFSQTKRFGGWRPTVFMQHGLMVGMWMAAATMLGVWMWWCRALRGSVAAWSVVLMSGLALTTLLVKSIGAIGLCIAGLAALASVKRLRVAWPILALASIPVGYEVSRGLGVWDGSHAVQLASMISRERAESLAFRINSENLLVANALRKPAFGWGGWGSFMTDESGEKFATPDGLWVIAIGKYGLFGLMAYTLVMLTPAVACVRRVSPKVWMQPEFAAMSGLAVLTVIYAIDNLFNAMVNPVFILALGGVAGVAVGSGGRSVRGGRIVVS